MQDNDAQKQNVVPFKPRVADLQKSINELALNSANVKWRATKHQSHAESRMDWRDITDAMMFEVLRTGMIRGDIEAGKNPGEWKAKVCKQMKGRREVGVVTIVVNARSLFVKTVEWEDMK